MSKAPNPQMKYSVPFAAAAVQGLQKAEKAERKEPTEIIQRATIKYLIEAGYIEKDDASRFELFWWLVDETVSAAQRICLNGGFSSSITLDSIHECMKDSKWLDGYREYVRDDIYKNGNPEKGPINREIGFRIRAGIDATTEKLPNGKARTKKVLGEIIQSYTPMESYNHKIFGPK